MTLATSLGSVIGAKSTDHTPSGYRLKSSCADLQGEPRFADAARAAESDQVVVVEQPCNVGDVAIAPDERGPRDRKVVKLNEGVRAKLSSRRSGCAFCRLPSARRGNPHFHVDDAALVTGRRSHTNVALDYLSGVLESVVS